MSIRQIFGLLTGHARHSDRTGRNLQRVVPTREKVWYDDRLDMRALLRNEFTLLQEGKPALEHTSPLIAQNTYWAVFAPSRR